MKFRGLLLMTLIAIAAPVDLAAADGFGSSTIMVESEAIAKQQWWLHQFPILNLRPYNYRLLFDYPWHSPVNPYAAHRRVIIDGGAAPDLIDSARARSAAEYLSQRAAASSRAEREVESSSALATPRPLTFAAPQGD